MQDQISTLTENVQKYEREKEELKQKLADAREEVFQNFGCFFPVEIACLTFQNLHRHGRQEHSPHATESVCTLALFF